ncbi:dual specificity protein phosphatase 14-like isoform X1 [Euwallacea similis]|uniref:dual specificity protein phosphatase 14-like isoform X1 n=2 Tax=Euwallacea similis TaxID=1736056 RepID=UPI00344FF77E
MEMVQNFDVSKARMPADILDKSDGVAEAAYDQGLMRLDLNPTLEMALRKSHISVLTDHLILTSAAFVNSGIIDAVGITCVISAAPELPLVPLSEEVTLFHRVNVLDSSDSNISQYFDEVADVIEQVAASGGRTLIHCLAGISRSATFCIAYLMKHRRISLLEAYNYVKARRPRIKPNCGFFKQLIKYEKSMFIKSTVQMVFNEFVQMSIPDVYDSQYRVVRRPKGKFRNNSRNNCRLKNI